MIIMADPMQLKICLNFFQKTVMESNIPRTASSQAMQSLFSAYDEDELIDDKSDPDANDDKISGSEDEGNVALHVTGVIPFYG